MQCCKKRFIASAERFPCKDGMMGVGKWGTWGTAIGTYDHTIVGRDLLEKSGSQPAG